MISPKSLDDHMLSFFPQGLIDSKVYALDKRQVAYKLDQNEHPEDWDLALKHQVINKLMETNWNRYPDPFPEELEELVAAYAGIASSENIVLGPGSDQIIVNLLNVFSRGLAGDLWVSSPSFPLYERYCKQFEIEIKLWKLDDNYQFDCQSLPVLKEGSILVFASPNNPSGSYLEYDALKDILEKNPKSFIVADEAYFEYAPKSYENLLTSFSNLIILRTFSKAAGSAGMRLGYMIASKEVALHVKKIQLPYYLNHFTVAATQVILNQKGFRDKISQQVAQICQERDDLYEFFTDFGELGITVFPSHTNFLLLKLSDNNICKDFYEYLIANGIQTRDLSAAPGLQGCLRLTIGKSEENIKVREAVKKYVGRGSVGSAYTHSA